MLERLRKAAVVLVVMLAVLASVSLVLDVATSRGLSWDYSSASATALEVVWLEERGWVVIPVLVGAPLTLLALAAVSMSRVAIDLKPTRVIVAASACLAVGWLWQLALAATALTE